MSAPRRAVVLFTRDLRVRDHPALRAACQEAEEVVPLFVVDTGIAQAGFTVPNRAAYLTDALRDLDDGLRRRGAGLVVRTGPVATETARLAAAVGATSVHVSDDVSAYGRRRAADLRAALGARIELRLHAGVTVVPAGAVTPAGGDHFKVFTPYFRAWSASRWRDELAPPRPIHGVPGLDGGPLPAARDLARGVPSPGLARGGETTAVAQLKRWVRDDLDGYGSDGHDDLAGDRTSHLSAALHFGCLSPLGVANYVRGREGGDAYVRQLAWRDFHHQVLAATPSLPRADYRPRARPWRDGDDDRLGAWLEGRTGYPIVDAGLRQLRAEGWMHNRARLVVASFLTKTLDVRWQAGADHFLEWLVDGDVANNSGNWQWVAGTGNDTRPNRVLNPLRQAQRFDRDGEYVRRWVPELDHVVGLEGGAIHTPWRLGTSARRATGYPDRIVDHDNPDQPALF